MDSPLPTRPTESTIRLPSDTHLGRVRLRVADLQRSLDFYAGTLGLSVNQDMGGTVVLVPRPGPDGRRGKHQLIVLEERPGVRPRPRRPQTTGLYHVALLLPSRRELGRTLLGLQERKYPLRGMSDHRVSESLYLDDPDGNGLEIYADRPRALWPVQNGVVQMTVEPMDLEGVIAAGREDPSRWTGLASETVVGHVHFTVSHMEPALAFYRDVVGFDEMMRVPTLAAVSAGGYHHHLNLNTWAGEGAPPDSDDTAGLIAWELRVPGSHPRRRLLDRLAAASALLEDSDVATARDPDGVRIEISGAD